MGSEMCIRDRPGPHVPSKSSRHRPPTSLEGDGEGSKLGGAYAIQVEWRPMSGEARNRSGGEVSCAKSTFSWLSGPTVEQNRRSQSLAWVSTSQRDNLFCFLLSVFSFQHYLSSLCVHRLVSPCSPCYGRLPALLRLTSSCLGVRRTS